jgi:hypothetical protein
MQNNNKGQPGAKEKGPTTLCLVSFLHFCKRLFTGLVHRATALPLRQDFTKCKKQIPTKRAPEEPPITQADWFLYGATRQELKNN